ncbi:hypothetical protein K439DRAFT_1342632 [Ramaria rubella]|nr:hypothetical protein K439DRAFT_1342632 [Ramaria rubella]
MATTEISRNLDISLHVIQRTIKLWNEISDVVKDPKTYGKLGKARLLDTPSVEFILVLLESMPELYLDEIAGQLQEQQDVSVSLSTIPRALKLLGITSKKANTSFLLKAAAECCEEAHNQYLFEISREPSWHLVFTDKSLVNMLTTYRTMGRSYKGQQAKVSSFRPGDR